MHKIISTTFIAIAVKVVLTSVFLIPIVYPNSLFQRFIPIVYPNGLFHGLDFCFLGGSAIMKQMSLIVRQENNWAYVLVIALISAMVAAVVIVHASNIKKEMQRSFEEQWITSFVITTRLA